MGNGQLPCDHVVCYCTDKCKYLESLSPTPVPTSERLEINLGNAVSNDRFDSVTDGDWDDGVDMIYLDSESIGEQ